MNTLAGEKRTAVQAQAEPKRTGTPWQLGVIRGWLVLILIAGVLGLVASAMAEPTPPDQAVRSGLMFLIQAVSLTGIAVTYLYRASAGG